MTNPEQTTANITAREAGRIDQRAGAPFTANPYPLNTGESRAWSRGWREAHADMPV